LADVKAVPPHVIEVGAVLVPKYVGERYTRRSLLVPALTVALNELQLHMVLLVMAKDGNAPDMLAVFVRATFKREFVVVWFAVVNVSD
jgi:hypothetical protein